MTNTVPAAGLARQSVSALLWMLAGSAGRAVAQFIVQIALARLLGPVSFGQFTLVMTFVGLGWLVSESGVGAALIQKHELEERDVAQALGWVLLVGTGIATTLMVAAPALAIYFAEPDLGPMLRVASVLIFVLALSNISISLLRRRLDERRLQAIQLGSYIAGFGVVGLALAAHGFGAWSMLVGFGVQSALTLVFCYASVRHTLVPRLAGDAAMRRFGVKVLANNVVNWSIESLDRMLIGAWWGTRSVGLYNAAFGLCRAPLSLIVPSFQSIAFSAAARIQDDDMRTRKGYLAVLAAVSLLLLPSFALAALEARAIVGLVYGPRWDAATPFFVAFAVAMPLYALAAVTGPFLQARNAVGSELLSQLAVVTLLFCGYALLRDFPLETAVWVVPAAFALRYVLLLGVLRHRLDLPLVAVARALGGGVVLAVCVGGVALVVRATGVSPQSLHGLVPLLCALVAGAGLVRLAGRLLVGAELHALMLGRAADSRVVRGACRLLGLGLHGGRPA